MKNSQSLDAIAENWYARLNNLKRRYTEGNLTDQKKAQLQKLIGIMIQRMMKITPYYIEAAHARFKPSTSFQPGGLTFKD